MKNIDIQQKQCKLRNKKNDIDNDDDNENWLILELDNIEYTGDSSEPEPCENCT